VVTFVWSTFSAMKSTTWAQITFLQVKDSLPLIELHPAWLIPAYLHRPCKRLPPSPQRCCFACNGASKWLSSLLAQFSLSPAHA
jgi:hypothetical protein